MSLDENKVGVIGEWLKEEFEGYTVHDVFDARRSSQFYRIDEGGKLRHRVLVSGEFIDDHAIQEITRLLDEWKLGAVIKSSGARQVIVTNGGARVETEAKE